MGIGNTANSDIDGLVRTAQSGDQAALEEVVRAIQDRVHHLAIRMLVNPEDALDATQEILVLVITKLSTFEFRSAFQTWVYRIATNYLLTAVKVLRRDPGLTFDAYREDLESDLAPHIEPDDSAEHQVLLNELRICCTMAILLCLDGGSRIAYILGDILELDHGEASAALAISKPAFRKQLSRARARVVAFTAQSCGLSNTAAKCSCPGKLPGAMRRGRVDPAHIAYANHSGVSYRDVKREAETLQGELRTLKLQTAIPRFESPRDFGRIVKQIVDGMPAPPPGH